MTETTETITPRHNRLLAALPNKEYQRLLPDLAQIDLSYGEIIYAAGTEISHVYFPEIGIVSLISVVDEQTLMEVGMIGNEGMVGLAVFLGVPFSITRAVVQGSGIAWKMKAADLIKECDHHDGKLPRLLKRYTNLLLTQTAHSAACNLYHPVEERLARWLLMSQDRMAADEFRLTQEFLSIMLGVRSRSGQQSGNQSPGTEINQLHTRKN